MSTLSVPLPGNLLRGLNNLVERGLISNKADGARKAIAKYLEEQAINDVLEAMKEPNLEGDLDELAKKMKF